MQDSRGGAIQEAAPRAHAWSVLRRTETKIATYMEQQENDPMMQDAGGGPGSGQSGGQSPELAAPMDDAQADPMGRHVVAGSFIDPPSAQTGSSNVPQHAQGSAPSGGSRGNSGHTHTHARTGVRTASDALPPADQDRERGQEDAQNQRCRHADGGPRGVRNRRVESSNAEWWATCRADVVR